jgi:SAM-dependent methyltransferase
MSDLYSQVTTDLARAYGRAVEVRSERDGQEPDWKIQERAEFLGLLRSEGCSSLIEIGAGTGVSGAFFAAAGLSVLCTDLSEAMVEHCRGRGLEALSRDVINLDVGRAFDAAWTMNCLLHVPPQDLDEAVAAIRDVLKPGGLFYLGQYGGVERTGVDADDSYEPPRYFSLLPDDDLRRMVSRRFEVVWFRTVDIGLADGMSFQSVVLRRPPDSEPVV